VFIAFITDDRGITGSFADPCSGDLYPCYCFSFNARGEVAMGEGKEMVPCEEVPPNPTYDRPGLAGERSDDYL